MSSHSLAIRRFAVLLISALALALSACGGNQEARAPSVGELDADRYLFERGKEALDRHHWLEAREYFKKLIDTYPSSDFRQDARLGIGDAYLGEKRVDTDVLASGEFKEFLRYYPLSDKADYAQYRLAVCTARQTLSPQRDQTATRDTLREIDTFIERYPTSSHMKEVLALQRQMKDKLAESEFLIGRHYYRTRWYPGAVSRLLDLVQKDPQYLGRDGVYFYLAESYMKLDKRAEALPYYEKLIAEFAKSSYLKDAKKRVDEIARADAQSSARGGGSAPAETTR
jgi:outer membrane protein assembly factor BamD